jgi:hypothetical protein
LSGHVRSGTEMNSTSSAKGRYRLVGIDVRRWVFHAGCPSFGAPDGVVMVCADVNASTDL